MQRQKKSTSVHSLSADNGLGLMGKVLWLIFNAANNRFTFSGLDSSLIQTDFVIDNLELDWGEFSRAASPARRLCDLFWEHLPLEVFEKELGGEIRALEVGCGTGIYGRYLNQRLGGRVRYRGLDIVSNKAWEEYKSCPNYEFVAGNSSDIRKHLKDINFIFTQSALEHFTEDLTFFYQIADYVHNVKRPVIQVHLIPSASCISTFPWHGVRQYSLRNISKITKLFSGSTEKALYKLGSSYCNKLHRDWITLPRYLRRYDRRKADMIGYERELYKAIKSDMKRPSGQTCFYALVLKTLSP